MKIDSSNNGLYYTEQSTNNLLVSGGLYYDAATFVCTINL